MNTKNSRFYINEENLQEKKKSIKTSFRLSRTHDTRLLILQRALQFGIFELTLVLPQ